MRKSVVMGKAFTNFHTLLALRHLMQEYPFDKKKIARLPAVQAEKASNPCL